MLLQRMFIWSRRPDEWQVFRVACPVLGEVAASVEQAQRSVRPTAYPVRVLLVLPIVFPEAHVTDFELASGLKGQISAARAGVGPVFWPASHIDEWCTVISRHARQHSTPSRPEGVGR